MSQDRPEQGPYTSAAQWTAQSREQYPPPPSQPGAYPSPSPYNQASPHAPPSSNDMLTLPPPSHMPQDQYRGHPQYDMYQGQQGQMPYPPGPHPGQQAPVNFAQPAPRQRTAIACRYCRRRKIRCHGFDSQPDGRCTNCVRFHQECIFTPVSSQAHAFVPAHTAYPHLRNTGRGDGRQIYPQGQPVIYGAHGQPLGPMGQPGHDNNYPPPPPGPQAYGPGPYPGYDERGPPPPGGHHPQDQSRAGPARRSSNAAYEYPDPTHMAPVSPASSTNSYHNAPYPPNAAPQPYYPSSSGAQPPPRRGSPQSASTQPSYQYESRTSGSPHGSTSSASGYTGYGPPGGLHPPQVLPPTYESVRTPPPSAGIRERGADGSAANGASAGGGSGSRPGMSVRELLGPGDGQGSRSSADSDMLKALNRRGM